MPLKTHLMMKTADTLPSTGIPALNGIIPLIVGQLNT